MTRNAIFGTAALVALAAVLAVAFWPAADVPTTAKASTARYTVRLSVDDPRAGPNSIGLEVTDPQGAPAAPDEVVVEPVMPQMGHAYPPVTATAEGPGRFRAAATDLPMAGPWQITVSLRDASGVDQVVLPLLVK
ncbi:FixH family protein [Umezawaea sp. Da 62-37]|uniref:FixH family protein n=1 Tax=Umezawaea sp. Da 62-37 TaxID=3075927 RepID=UPI0028F6C269|nr:FixH family protein [Umezawaea sp. Da 62-37]WNV83996.1 FixH family protein [Umezawaea sp. Da 62-37]